MSTRTQYRAICSVCGRDQAVNGDAIVDHGYNLEYHWRNGTCDGARISHFGTEAGRDYRASIALRYIAHADRTERLANAISKGEVVAKKFDKKTKESVDLTDPWEIRQRVESLRREADSVRGEAKRLQRTVDEWQPQSPREVQVEATKAPLIHFYRERWGKFCAGSAMGALKGHTTSSWEHVNCEKCKARKAYFDAQGRKI